MALWEELTRSFLFGACRQAGEGGTCNRPDLTAGLGALGCLVEGLGGQAAGLLHFNTLDT